jgi:hypothetical protein
MIKTLRITSFLAAFIALGFFIFIATRGLAANENVENLLKLPGVAEQFQADSAGRKASDSEAETPLMKQAKAFALRLNPPPPPEPVRPKSLPNEIQRPQATIAAKFMLIGTSYHFGDEAGSLALIDEVGKGLHWVRQGDKVGYLIVEKIGDGKVLINDSGNVYELIADREKMPDLVKSYTGPVIKNEPIVLWNLEEEAAKSKPAIPVPVPSADNNEASVLQLSPEEMRQQAQESIEWIKKLQQDPNSLGMTAEEANELGGLGELLKSLKNEVGEPNKADDSNSARVSDVNQRAKEAQEVQEQQIQEEQELQKQEQQIQQEQEQSEPEPSPDQPRRIRSRK